MIPRILLGTAGIPDTDKVMHLYRSGDLFSIKIPGRGDLMNSRMHGSGVVEATPRPISPGLVLCDSRCCRRNDDAR
jgi:hypothetical protein